MKEFVCVQCTVHHLSTTSGAAHILVFVVLHQHPPERNSVTLKTRTVRSFETSEKNYSPTLGSNPEGYRALLSRIVGQKW